MWSNDIMSINGNNENMAYCREKYRNNVGENIEAKCINNGIYLMKMKMWKKENENNRNDNQWSINENSNSVANQWRQYSKKMK